MEVMNDFPITVHSGGDEAVAAVQRASPFVSQLGAAIGLGADALDAAFREAATL